MAIERTDKGRLVFLCDVCADLGIERVWVREPGKEGLPKNCSGPQKHSRWNYREREAAEARTKHLTKVREKRKLVPAGRF